MTEPPVVDLPLRQGRRWPALLAVAIILVLVLGRLALHYGAEVTVQSAFYDGIGMGDVYSKRWHTNVLLGVIGVLAGLLFVLPAIFVWRISSRRQAKTLNLRDAGFSDAVERWMLQRVGAERIGQLRGVGQLRVIPIVGFVVLVALFATSMATQMVARRDELFGFFNSQSFGVADPVFNKDVGFYVFQHPTLTGLLGLLASGLLFSIIITIAAAAVRWIGLMATGRMHSASQIAARARTISLVLLGLLVVVFGVLFWLSRYGLVVGGDEIVAGAGKATRTIDIPTRAVGSVVMVLVGVATMLAAIPAIRRQLSRLTLQHVLLVVGGVWALLALILTFGVSPMWFVLLVPAAIVVLVGLGRAGNSVASLRTAAPAQSLLMAGGITCVALAILGPVGAAINDAVVLRGTRLQVERENIAATITATRAATGLDKAQVVDAPYKRAAVTRKAIAVAPASVGSIRFLDIPPTSEACSRLQTFNQFYKCDDVDVDRYTLDGKRRTVFSIGREIDYDKLSDFQRRHFTYTHGYGLVLAPVNEIERNTGRPVWAAGDIPQRGLTFEGDNGSIYFGAQRNVPWSIVGTSQPVFDKIGSTKPVQWNGATGVKVGSGWRRLAITEFLGGLPYIGGGRRVWNATAGNPADANSSLLLYRDMTARVNEIAPFMRVDNDPYFVAENGRLYVMAPLYAQTTRYPYAAQFQGVRYMRQSTVAVMDAYSGETNLYVLDDTEPITRAWRSVYPSLFTPGDKLPPELRRHLRLGETGLNVVASAARQFHVTEVDALYNGDEAWAPTVEAYGPGVQGEPLVSPIRYTYAVLPGDDTERFVAVQSYKPAVSGRGIGFAGWLAVVNDPDDASGPQFGRTVLLRFRGNETEPLDSLDTFTGNVAKNESLSSEIGVRKDSVLRGNTIVVPVGQGLLYVQPLYLDSTNDSLPTLWKVIVSFGDGQVFSAPTLEQALNLALGDGGETPEPAPGTTETVAALVSRASTEFEAYQKAFGAGDYDAAAKHLKAFRTALARARALAAQQEAKP